MKEHLLFPFGRRLVQHSTCYLNVEKPLLSKTEAATLCRHSETAVQVLLDKGNVRHSQGIGKEFANLGIISWPVCFPQLSHWTHTSLSSSRERTTCPCLFQVLLSHCVDLCCIATEQIAALWGSIQRTSYFKSATFSLSITGPAQDLMTPGVACQMLPLPYLEVFQPLSGFENQQQDGAEEEEA